MPLLCEIGRNVPGSRCQNVNVSNYNHDLLDSLGQNDSFNANTPKRGVIRVQVPNF